MYDVTLTMDVDVNVQKAFDNLFCDEDREQFMVENIDWLRDDDLKQECIRRGIFKEKMKKVY